MDETPGDERSYTDDPPVTVSVTRCAKPKRVEKFEKWIHGIIAAASRFPGHLGAEVFSLGGPTDTEYLIVFKFDHESNLRGWEESVERREWYERVMPLQQGSPRRQVVTGLESWFVLSSRGVGANLPPPRHKMALVAWLAVYPLITGIFFVPGDLLLQLPLILRTMALTGIMVPTMFYVVMPTMTRLFAGWLYPEGEAKRTEVRT